MPRKSLLALIMLAAVTFLLVYPKVYVVRDGANGVLFWDANEALLFVEVPSSGAHMSYLRYVLDPFLVSMGDVRSPDDNRCLQVLVMQITDEGVKRYETNLQQYAQHAYCFVHYVLFEGQIYTGYPDQGRMWRWSGTKFELASTEELRGFDSTKEAQRGVQFDNAGGWSMRQYPLGRVSYSLNLNGQPVTFVSSGRAWPPGNVSVQLLRPGRPPETIWSQDQRQRILSKTEYDDIFRPH